MVLQLHRMFERHTMNWIREHIPTISLLLVVFLALLAGIAIGGILVFMSGFWLVVSGDLGDMLIVSWGMYAD
jgi:uncharacterized membrane protein